MKAKIEKKDAKTKQDKREVKAKPEKIEKAKAADLDAKAICALGPKYGLNIEAKASRIAIRRNGVRIGKIEGHAGIQVRSDEGEHFGRPNFKDHRTHLEDMIAVKAFLRGLSEIELPEKVEKPKASAKPKSEKKAKKHVEEFEAEEETPRRKKLSRLERRKLRRLKEQSNGKRNVGKVHEVVDLKQRPRRK